MFGVQQCSGRNPRLYFTNNKKLPKVLSPKRSQIKPKGCTLFLEHCCNPKGSFAYKLFFEMQHEKKFVAVVVRDQTTQNTDITELMYHIQNICTLDKDQRIIKTLHHMYLSSVRGRDLLPDGELDRISTLYECLKDFYENTANQVRYA